MRLALLCCVMLSISVSVQSQQQKICTFNIKFDNPGDGVHQWDNRKEQIVNFIKVEDIDVIGMQEVLNSQIKYLEQNLLDYHRVGVGRDDGKTKGEFTPIFFRKERYKLLDNNTFWLSPNYNKVGKGWDAAYIRICTFALLFDKTNNETILVLNTHLDNEGEKARIESIDLIMEIIEDMTHNEKIVLMGDFNLEPEKEPVRKVVNAGFTDSYEAPLKSGPVGTFNGFKINENHNRRIDYVFLKGLSPISYVSNSILVNGTFLSDHFPVVVEVN